MIYRYRIHRRDISTAGRSRRQRQAADSNLYLHLPRRRVSVRFSETNTAVGATTTLYTTYPLNHNWTRLSHNTTHTRDDK